MRAICPNDENHKEFITSAHIMQDWVVDDSGDFIRVHEDLVTTHKPDPDNEWTCAICKERAVVTK